MKLAPATFLTRDAIGVMRAYNDQSQRCPRTEAPEGLPIIDIQPEHVRVANEAWAKERQRESIAARMIEATDADREAQVVESEAGL